jgi:hypothetical protein
MTFTATVCIFDMSIKTKGFMIRKDGTSNRIFILTLFLSLAIYSGTMESREQKPLNNISFHTPHHRTKVKHKKLHFDKQLKTDKVIMPFTTINNLISVMDDKTIS